MCVACAIVVSSVALFLHLRAGLAGGPTVAFYVLVLSLLSFVLYGIDKSLARRGSRRLRESDLLGLALLGGAPGAWWGMRQFHHKTRHRRFQFLVPALSILWIAATLYTMLRA